MIGQPSPGPWRVILQGNDLLIVDSWDGLIARVPDAHRPEQRANAELLAAAPQLAALSGWQPKGADGE